MKNYVYIATSLDGYIADKNDGLGWLPAPDENNDFGFNDFMNSIDAIVMGKNTFNMVVSFGGEWPYCKPVYVVSNTLKSIPKSLEQKVFLIKGTAKEILKKLHAKDFKNLYIDGGMTIQKFLQEDLIDEIIITVVPTLLGEGKPLFSQQEKRLQFKCIESKVIEDMVQNHFVKKR